MPSLDGGGGARTIEGHDDDDEVKASRHGCASYIFNTKWREMRMD
jgi:hypothetical protein